jgi:hypothetical protein
MIRLSKAVAIAAALSLGSIGSAMADPASFNFDSLDPTVTGNIVSTPFSLSSGGVTASFSSDQDPGGFQVLNLTGGLSFADDVLVTPNTSGTGPLLEIVFSQPLLSFTAEFATEGSGPLTLTALNGGVGGTQVGSSSATGSVPDGFMFPEGTVSFSGATFDSLVLSDANDPGFALGNFSVDTAPVTSVPEPSSFALALEAALGLIGLTLARRFRKN